MIPEHSRLHHFRRNPRHDFANRLAQLHHSAFLLAEPFSDGYRLSRSASAASRKSARRFFGLAAWLLMIFTYVAHVGFYTVHRVAPLCRWRVILPISHPRFRAAYWTGRGGVWKDRVQDAR